ncbi:MAG: hypothetical protein HUU55_05350 [Myxococcales bacterium]|nr:hypothetical protein [Myxococcales bacterium]
MNENSTTGSTEVSQALAWRSKIRTALRPFDALTTAPSVAALDVIKLLRVLAAQIDAECSHQRLISEYLEHNLAVLFLRITALNGAPAQTRALGDAMAPLLWAAFLHDPEDFVLLAALTEQALLGSPDDVRPDLLQALPTALANPAAGFRTLTQAAKLVVHGFGAKDGKVRSAAERILAKTVQELTSYLAKSPFQSEIAECRLRVGAVVLKRSDGKARVAAFRQMRTWITDYEARFGETPAMLRAKVSTALKAATDKVSPNPQMKVEARDLILTLDADLQIYNDEEWIQLVTAADRAELFSKEERRTLAQGLTRRIDSAAGPIGHRLRRLRRELWEACGDDAALLADSIERIQNDPKDRAAASEIIVRVWADKKAGAPDTDVPPECLQAAAEAASHRTYDDWSATDANLWLDVLLQRLGPQPAADLMLRHVLTLKTLRSDEALVTRVVHLLDSLGNQDEAFKLAKQGIDKEGLLGLRIWVARKLLEKGERLSEAEALVRPLVAMDGPLGVDGQRLRDEINRHPAYEESRRAELLEFEAKIHVGTEKKHKLRVLFPGTGFALAELVDSPAPPSYGHKYLRVMIRRADLPSFLDIVDLQKGTELFAPIRGEDDKKNKGGLRVYWVAEGSVAEPGWSEEKRKKQVHLLEEKFKINSGASLPLKILRVLKTNKTAWAALESPPGVNRELFPADVCILAGDLPDGKSIKDLSEGQRVFAPVDATDDPRGTQGERRYRVRGPIEIAGGDHG